MLAAAGLALARVGGGHSYSGGGSSSSGGSGGGGGGGGAELVFYFVRFLFWLTINYPAIGIPVDIVVIIVIVRWLKKKNDLAVFRTGGGSTVVAKAAVPGKIRELRRYDPNFSEITFSDFCYSLYARVHKARGEGKLDQYAPYLSDSARNLLRTRNRGDLREVRGIVIGAFNVISVHGIEAGQVWVTVEYEANYTEIGADAQTSWYVREQWTLERRRDILSPPPEKAKADHCPRCGAALQTRTDGACDYCGVKITGGSFQWFVRSISLMERDTRGPLLTSTVPEVGTSNRTVFQPMFAERRKEFDDAHPGFDWPGFENRVVQIAIELQNAWTARDWERVRPLESENLFQMHRYWIDAYRKQNLRNVVSDFKVTRVQPVKIDSDPFYESITARVWAEGRDHTIDAKGQVVAGSPNQTRKWTEYWTFIRSRGAAAGAGRISCPNCSAQVTAGTSGVCDYCGGKLTTGSFDWVLSRIEQDEAYA